MKEKQVTAPRRTVHCFAATAPQGRGTRPPHSMSQSVSQSVQSLSRVRLFATPWTAARQASLSITNSRSLLKLMSIESVMPSSHLILCRPLFLPSSIFPSIRVFSNESLLCIRGPKYWSFSFSISPSSEYAGLNSMNRAHQEGWALSLLQSGGQENERPCNERRRSVCVCVCVCMCVLSLSNNWNYK